MMEQHPKSHVDWKAFADYFKRLFPASSETGMSIEQTVKASIASAMADLLQDKSEQIEQFETHRSIIIKLKLPHRQQLNDMHLQLNDAHMKISGWRQHDIQTIRFPTAVWPKTAKAVYRNGVLQIQIRKKEKRSSYHVINVDH